MNTGIGIKNKNEIKKMESALKLFLALFNLNIDFEEKWIKNM